MSAKYTDRHPICSIQPGCEKRRTRHMHVQIRAEWTMYNNPLRDKRSHVDDIDDPKRITRNRPYRRSKPSWPAVICTGLRSWRCPHGRSSARLSSKFKVDFVSCAAHITVWTLSSPSSLQFAFHSSRCLIRVIPFLQNHNRLSIHRIPQHPVSRTRLCHRTTLGQRGKVEGQRPDNLAERETPFSIHRGFKKPG